MSPLTFRAAARFPRLPAAGKAALTAFLLALFTYEGFILVQQPTEPHIIMWGAGIAACLCAIPFRRIPLTVRASTAVAISWTATALLVAGSRPIDIWGAGEALALLVLLTGVLLRTPTRTAVTLGPLLALGCMAVPVRDLDPGHFTLIFAVATVITTAYLLLLREKIAQRRRDTEAVREAERLEIARELHDVVAHHITGIIVQAQAARFTALDGQAAADICERIENAAIEALGAMRRLVKVLRTGGLERTAQTAPVAGMAQVHQMAENFSRAGPHVVLSVENGLADRIPREVATGVHRIVREALTNIRKHAADATAVRIALRTLPGGLELRIENDGGKAATLPEKAQGDGFGVTGMSERATALGGELHAGPAPGGGWLVTATLPF